MLGPIDDETAPLEVQPMDAGSSKWRLGSPGERSTSRCSW